MKGGEAIFFVLSSGSCESLINVILIVNPITYGGGVGPEHKIIDHNSKTALSIASKLVDFLFYLLDTFW